MSHRGRGSGSRHDEHEGEETARGRGPGGYPLPPAAARPIVPYDPYRSRGESRSAGRNAGAQGSPPYPRRDLGREDPFLPEDDPLNSEAWQLELDEVGGDEDDTVLPDIDLAPPRRGARRQPPPATKRREASTSGARTARRGRASASERTRPARTAPTIAMPQILAGSPLAADQTALALLAIDIVSFLVMALLLGVRLSGIPSPTVLRLDAAGNPDFWGPASVLWRLPLMSLFLTVMFLVVAWFIHPLDRFAARFALGAAIVAQLIAWVAVIQHLA
jgi:hypothetical protein